MVGLSKSNGHTVVTFQQHVLQEQRRFPEASGEFSWLLSGITLATKRIQAKVRCAGLCDVLGSGGEVNVQGEDQQRLDVYANNALVSCLSLRENVALLVSEENDRPIVLPRRPGRARYAVFFDPLDGSSNIDVNASVGTIFSIVRLPNTGDEEPMLDDALQPASRQIAAGYVIYGSSTILVYSAGSGVHGFTLDPSIGAFVLSHENIRMPLQGPYYSVNEAYFDTFPPAYRDFLHRLRSGQRGSYASRYIGSLVADFHRTLLKGGVFLYPPTEKYPDGKLRLLYEVQPLALIAEQAGGIATDGTSRLLDVKPTTVHQRIPLVVGSQTEMLLYERCRRETAASMSAESAHRTVV